MKMKPNRLMITEMSAACALMIACGCSPSNDSTPTTTPTSAEVSAKLDQAKEQTKEAVAAIKDYSYAQREEYAAQMRAQLDQTKHELDDLSIKLESSASAANDDAKARIQQLHQKLDDVSKQLDGVKDSTESNWAQFQAGVNKAYDDLKESFNKARQWLSDKIAPK